MRKIIEIYGIKVPITAILIAFLVISTVTAALVSSFVQHDTEVNVTAPLYINGSTTAVVDLVSGECNEYIVMSIVSNASVPTLTEMVTVIEDGEGITVIYTYEGEVLPDMNDNGRPEFVVPALSDGEEIRMDICTSPALEAKTYVIETLFVPPVGIDMVVLDNKDSGTWEVVDDAHQAIVIYETESDEFNFVLIGNVPDANTDYTLVYYGDYEARFNDWGGDNPGAVLGTATSDDGGDIDMYDVVELDMDMPSAPDANADVDNHDYRGAPDYYCDGTGAKLWLVATDDLDNEELPVTGWNPDSWLFETGLIQYTDSNL